jgi:DNA-binding MarR family transcriptional regulator
MLSQQGLHLVHAYENPAGRRSKLVELTSSGTSALSAILDAVHV